MLATKPSNGYLNIVLKSAIIRKVAYLVMVSIQRIPVYFVDLRDLYDYEIFMLLTFLLSLSLSMFLSCYPLAYLPFHFVKWANKCKKVGVSKQQGTLLLSALYFTLAKCHIFHSTALAQ